MQRPITRGMTDHFLQRRVRHEKRLSLRERESPMYLSRDHSSLSGCDQTNSCGHIRLSLSLSLSLSSCFTRHCQICSVVPLVLNGATSYAPFFKTVCFAPRYTRLTTASELHACPTSRVLSCLVKTRKRIRDAS